jgi:hypothetical protein
MSARERRAIIAHRGQGRTRLRFRGEVGDRAFFEDLHARLSAVPGVVDVQTRPHTGSVLVLHGCSWPELARRVASSGLFVLDEDEEKEAPGDPAALIAATAPELIVAGGLAALAALQVLRGKVLPPTATLAWYAYELASRHFVNTQKESTRGR